MIGWKKMFADMFIDVCDRMKQQIKNKKCKLTNWNLKSNLAVVTEKWVFLYHCYSC